MKNWFKRNLLNLSQAFILYFIVFIFIFMFHFVFGLVHSETWQNPKYSLVSTQLKALRDFFHVGYPKHSPEKSSSSSLDKFLFYLIFIFFYFFFFFSSCPLSGESERTIIDLFTNLIPSLLSMEPRHLEVFAKRITYSSLLLFLPPFSSSTYFSNILAHPSSSSW